MSSARLTNMLAPRPGTSGLAATRIIAPATLAPGAGARFRVLEQQLLQVDVPASLPLYARVGSVLGVLGESRGFPLWSAPVPQLKQTSKSQNFAARTLVPRGALARVWAGQPAVYQRLLATEPSTCLFSSQGVLTAFDLDGTRDVIVCSAKVEVYTPETLEIRNGTAWAGVGRPPFAHVAAIGRGSLALASESPLVETALQEGESVLINKKALAAYTLEPGTPRPKLVTLKYSLSPRPAPRPSPATGNVAVDAFLAKLCQVWQYGLAEARRLIRSSNGDFVEIQGPSRVYVGQADAPQGERYEPWPESQPPKNNNSADPSGTQKSS